MLSFQAWGALLGLALLAIPVLVHLFQPRRVRQTPFSSLRWLHLTQQRLSRRIKWHQILLFLLRAGFITLLVLAIARPIFRPPGDAAFVERIIVLDVSRSMGYRPEGRPTPLEHAKEIAGELITRGLAGDGMSILLTGDNTRILLPLVRDAETALPALRAVEAGTSDTNLSSALPLVRSLLPHCRENADIELYFLTDNHQQSWRQGEIAAFLQDPPRPVKAKVIDVSAPSPQNAWIADARLTDAKASRALSSAKGQADGVRDRQWITVRVKSLGDPGQKRTVRISGSSGFPERSQPVLLDNSQAVDVHFDFPAELDTAGVVARIRLDPEDELPTDDEFFLNLDTAGTLGVLLVESDAAATEMLRPGFHLRTAISALALAGRQPVTLIARSPTNLAPGDVANADVILLADVPDLSEANLSALKSRVEGGAGLAIFLGPGGQLPFYNSKLFDPLRPQSSLLPLALKSSEQIDTRKKEVSVLENVRWDHPLLAGLFDPVLGDVAQTRFHTFFRFTGELPKGDRALAWIDPATPAIVEHPVGAGRVLLFNTTPNDAWSDLPRTKGFVPLVDRMLTQLSGGGVRHSFVAGEPIVLSVPEVRSGETVVIRTPEGDEVTPVLSNSQGKTLVRAEPVETGGVFQLERKGGRLAGFPFVVQTGRGDSQLTLQDEAVLKKWWEPLELAVVPAHTTTPTGIASPQLRLALWPWFVALGCALFFAEMFFVHWLCPRINPVVISPLIRHRQAPTAEGIAVGSTAPQGVTP